MINEAGVIIKDYSQHFEQQTILDYFGNFTGTLLDIGSNDGVTFSNSRALLEKGWYGVLVEPSEETFAKLEENCLPFTGKVMLHNVGIADYCGNGAFFESGELIGGDHSLVSSMKKEETKRWRKKSKPSDPVVSFKKTQIPVIDFATLLKNSGLDTVDFITIDVEGMELEILKQIDIADLGCRLVCIEYNGKPELAEAYDALIPHPVLHKNRTNIIYGKPRFIV